MGLSLVERLRQIPDEVRVTTLEFGRGLVIEAAQPTPHPVTQEAASEIEELTAVLEYIATHYAADPLFAPVVKIARDALGWGDDCYSQQHAAWNGNRRVFAAHDFIRRS